MDPFSLAVGLLTLVGTCATTRKTLNRIRSLRHAPALLQALNNEIVDLQLVLVDVKEYFDKVKKDEADGLSTSILERGRLLVEQTRNKVLEVDMLVQYEVLKAGREGSFEVNWIAFLREQSHLQQLQTDLRHAKQHITELFSHIKVQEASNILTDIRLVGDRAHNDMLAGFSMLSNGQTRIEEILHQMMRESSSSTRPLSPSFSDNASQSGRLQPYSKQVIEIQMAHDHRSLSKPRCSYNRQTTFLQACLGRLFIGYTNVPTFQPCFHPRFRDDNWNSGLTVSYYFPVWFLYCVILFHIQLTGAFDLTLTLSVRHTLPFDHLMWKFMRIGNVDGMKKLFSTQQVSIHAKDMYGVGLLDQAILMGRPQAAKFLLQLGIDPYGDMKENLMYDTLEMNLMQKINAPPYRRAWSLLLSLNLPIQIRNEWQSLFPQPDFDDLFGFSPLHKAVLNFAGYDLAKTCNTENLKAVDYDGRTPLVWALRNGSCNAAELLLAFGADCNKADDTRRYPIQFAVYRCLHCVSLLLAAGADVNASTKNSMTALHYAAEASAEFKPLQFVETLVAAGAKVNAQICDGRTALHFALEEDNQDVAEYLIKHGADPSILDAHGNNALCWATRENRHSTLELLLHMGQDHLQYIQRIRTFMHLAAEAADVRSLQLLACGRLERRDINIKNGDGLTPIQVALHRTDVDAEWREAFVNFLKAIDKDDLHSQESKEFQDVRDEPVSMGSFTTLEEEFDDAVEIQA